MALLFGQVASKTFFEQFAGPADECQRSTDLVGDDGGSVCQQIVARFVSVILLFQWGGTPRFFTVARP